jgi:hypothetical protein
MCCGGKDGRSCKQGRITLFRLVAPYLKLRKSYRSLEIARQPRLGSSSRSHGSRSSPRQPTACSIPGKATDLGGAPILGDGPGQTQLLWRVAARRRKSGIGLKDTTKIGVLEAFAARCKDAPYAGLARSCSEALRKEATLKLSRSPFNGEWTALIFGSWKL